LQIIDFSMLMNEWMNHFILFYFVMFVFPWTPKTPCCYYCWIMVYYFEESSKYSCENKWMFLLNYCVVWSKCVTVCLGCGSKLKFTEAAVLACSSQILLNHGLCNHASREFIWILQASASLRCVLSPPASQPARALEWMPWRK